MEQNQVAAQERVAWGRFIWVAPLVIVLSVVANLIVRAISKAVFAVPDTFMPFGLPNVIFLTTAGTVGAALVFALVGWLSKRPFRLFKWIAGVVLVLTWLPDIGLLIARPFPGITVPGVLTLMLMHLETAAITLWLYNSQARAR